MKNTIEVLKKNGIINKIQDMFDKNKPPKGLPEEMILEAIEERLDHFTDKDEEFANEFFDAVFNDVAQAVRNELKIEFIDKDEFVAQSIPQLLSMLLGKDHVCFHIVCEKEKGKGDE